MMRATGRCCAALLLGSVLVTGQTATVTVASVADAMGARNLKTIEYSGSGYSFAFQQASGPGEPWPLFVVDEYKMSVDYSTPSMRFESTRSQGVPGKPLRYLVNTHAHFGHAGGVREYAAEGVTIITHEMNRSYYENVWRRPRTLHPDRLALQPRAPIWETMTEKKIVIDGSRTLELHKLQGNGHNPYLLIGYLPAEKILLYGDMYNPPAGSDPRDRARTNEYAENLYDNVATRLKLDVQLIAPIHGLPVPFDNLKKAIGLIPLSQ